MLNRTRRDFLFYVGKVGALSGLSGNFGAVLRGEESRPGHADSPTISTNELLTGWLNPARTFRPHTRWAWPGSAVTRDGISWQLQQMRDQGHGGAEIQIPWVMYAQGNIPYLSDQWLEMVRHAISKAAELDMEIALTFGPGWAFGGFFVPPAERSKVLTHGWVDRTGPADLDLDVPGYTLKDPAALAKLRILDGTFRSDAPDEKQIVAVVAGRLEGDRLDGESLVDLTAKLEGNRLRWQLPEGHWRLMAFRLKYTGQRCATTENFDQPQWVVDHMSKRALRNYCDYLGETFYRAFGEEFGKTVDSLFCDSFEIFCLPETLLWSNDTLERFKAYKNYDLKAYLPAIWWDIGELTPRIRYDVNDFLSWLGLDTVFATFAGWCAEHNVQARIQPHYRFTEEIIQGAGMTQRPETEVNTTCFAVVADPRKATTAGARFYGEKILSAEAYTFLHMERYRTTLEEMKIATDSFLRDGVTQFYNIEYLYSPEMYVAPSRDLPWGNRISHWNIWWKYYHHLAEYVSRCCYLLRQGRFAGDVLIYSPQSTVWTQKVLFVNDRRVMPYGDLPRTLVANGYDFDPVNDDVLQHHAKVEGGLVKIGEYSYRFLILPNTTALPLATMEFIREFAHAGGVVIALEALPSSSTGLEDSEERDRKVREMATEVFGTNRRANGVVEEGTAYFLPDYKIVEPVFTPMPRPLFEATAPLQGPRAELVNILRSYLSPDFVLEGSRQSDGLTFIHRHLGQDDLYFVTNLQPYPSRMKVIFRVRDKIPEEWDVNTGEVRPMWTYEPHEGGIAVALYLPAWASTCLLFRTGPLKPWVPQTSLDRVLDVTANEVRGLAGQNGKATVTVVTGEQTRTGEVSVSDLPQPFQISGRWQMVLAGHDFPTVRKSVAELRSWTDEAEAVHFSGMGRYEQDFELPAEYVHEELELALDLGSVGSIAEVILNGRNIGVAWMQPYRLRATDAVRSGANHLTVLVTNTLINYVSGLSKLPNVPEELVPHYGPTVNIYTDGARQSLHEIGFHPLPASGLMGPVRIVPRRKVTLKL